MEMHMHGSVDSRLFKQEFKSYIAFLQWADQLNTNEQEVFQRYEDWFYEVERTGMAKSYKMVLLSAMLERGPNDWMKPITAKEVAPFFHQYLMEKEYRKRIDFSDNTTKKLWDYDESKIASLIEKMPMTKWSGSSKGMLAFEAGVFRPTFDVGEEDAAVVYEFTGLNTIKPEMVEEATKNARATAQKFADDSGATLGGIRSAQQGQFSIEDRDAHSPYIKRVRVVNRVEYSLE